VIVTPSGVKVLDFGLAKFGTPGKPGQSSESIANMPTVANMPTMLESVTGAGVILGTLYYMVPEQVEGRNAGRTGVIRFLAG
jgi:eukaryotic-like serine/threonine-protein kinase